MENSHEETIIPPARMKETIEKTAGYIARNGQSFVNRLLKESNDKFSFLNSTDPFHKYYEACVKDYKNNSSSKIIANDVSAPPFEHSTRDDNPLPDLEKFKFLVDLPIINPLDLEVLKTTAMFCSINNDPNYQEKLLQHVNKYPKARQSQFDFMKSNHRLHDLFQLYLNQYKSLVNLSEELISKIKAKDMSDYELTQMLMTKAYLRAEHASFNKLQSENEAKIKELEKVRFASVSWDDFKIVETIDFLETDKYAELPFGIEKNSLIYRSLQQKQANSLLEEAPPDYDYNEEINPNYVDNSSDEEQVEAQEVENNKNSIQLPSMPKKGMRIKQAGQSRLNNVFTNKHSTKYVISPITGESILETELENHMKTVLRDPRYEQEKQNYMKKNAMPSNLSSNEVFNNFKRLRGETVNEEGRNNKKSRVQ